MKESLMRKQLISTLPHVFVQSVETGPTALGIPDLYFFDKCMKRSGWIELKQVDDFRDLVRVPFRPGQYNWIRRYTNMGGLVYLVCTSRKGKFWYVFKGDNVQQTYDGNNIMAIADWCGSTPDPRMLV